MVSIFLHLGPSHLGLLRRHFVAILQTLLQNLTLKPMPGKRHRHLHGTQSTNDRWVAGGRLLFVEMCKMYRIRVNHESINTKMTYLDSITTLPPCEHSRRGKEEPGVVSVTPSKRNISHFKSTNTSHERGASTLDRKVTTTMARPRCAGAMARISCIARSLVASAVRPVGVFACLFTACANIARTRVA